MRTQMARSDWRTQRRPRRPQSSRQKVRLPTVPPPLPMQALAPTKLCSTLALPGRAADSVLPRQDPQEERARGSGLYSGLSFPYQAEFGGYWAVFFISDF